MAEKIRVVHYINQFFAGMGGEDKADVPPERRAGAVGPGARCKRHSARTREIVATILCGDTYFSEHADQAADDLIAMIKDDKPDLVIGGPAFDSGRYGMACGKICVVAQDNTRHSRAHRGSRPKIPPSRSMPPTPT